MYVSMAAVRIDCIVQLSMHKVGSNIIIEQNREGQKAEVSVHVHILYCHQLFVCSSMNYVTAILS